jgi:hypothetical protein
VLSVASTVSRCAVLASPAVADAVATVTARFNSARRLLAAPGPADARGLHERGLALPPDAVQAAGLRLTPAGNLTLTLYVFLPAVASLPNLARCGAGLGLVVVLLLVRGGGWGGTRTRTARRRVCLCVGWLIV